MKKQPKSCKRYFMSVIEEMVMNTEYQWGRGGRIEVTDSKSKSDYPVYEARWFLPCEIADKFREIFDFKEFDKLPYLRFDMYDYDEKKAKWKKK